MARTDTGEQPRSRIKSRVCFGAPKDVRRKGGGPAWGTIVDEVWVPDTQATSQESSGSWGDYGFCAQRIQWDAGGESIRLGYWRRRAGEKHWSFASQTTVTSNPQTIRRLLEATLARDWFSRDAS